MERRWAESCRLRAILPRVAHVPPRIEELGEQQGGVVSIEQLRAASFGKNVVGRLKREGWLRRIHRGVYALGPRPLTGVGRMWAAVLAYDGAPLSHRSAAAVWNLVPWPTGRIDVSPLRHRRSTAAIRVHQPRTLTLDDITRDPEHGLPVTTVARTLSDVTPALTPPRLKQLCHRAEHLLILDVPDPCPAKLRTALDTLKLAPPQITRSELERLFLALVEQTPLPPPLVNH